MAKQFTQISVTEEDIRKGFVNDSAKCVVATTLGRTIPGATRIEVDTQTIRYTGTDGKRHVFLTPYAVYGYIVAFDAGDDIEPFAFRLWHNREITTRRQQRTEAGRAKDQADGAARREHQAKAKADIKAADPTLSPSERKLAEAESEVRTVTVRKAEAKREAVRAAIQGKAKSAVTEGDRSRPRRVRAYKTRVRHYGWRVMRVNQVEN